MESGDGDGERGLSSFSKVHQLYSIITNEH